MSAPSPKSSFPPVVDEHTRLLICGSLPGEASLRATRYYAHPQNQFWRLLAAVLEEPVAELPYEERLTVLLRRGVGLWDTVATAHRAGSLDGALREVTRNRLRMLADELPKLEAVAFNGATAARLGRRELAGTALTLVDLPSSSPAYTLSYADKAAQWAALRPLLS